MASKRKKVKFNPKECFWPNDWQNHSEYRADGSSSNPRMYSSIADHARIQLVQMVADFSDRYQENPLRVWAAFKEATQRLEDMLEPDDIDAELDRHRETCIDLSCTICR